ncbi:hypothetical protein ISR94_00575 [Candidatus Microgenomates bacterium]|nr:hypothetical protein [Candidatus Microgenomates bacterium]
MDENLAQKAINLALKCEWEKAIEVNEKILKTNKEDVDALNRLARASAEIGKTAAATKCCKKVIKIDPSNAIANKALVKYKKTKINMKTASDKAAGPSTFLEEPGKTKIVILLNPGDSKFLATLDAGDKMLLNTHSHRVSITTSNGKHIGRLPDDLAARIKTLVSGGNKYEVFVKSVENTTIKVFLKEIERGKDFINTPSFHSEKIEYISYTPPGLVNKDRPETGVEEDGF